MREQDNDMRLCGTGPLSSRALVKGTVKMMTRKELKVAHNVMSAILLLAGLATIAISGCTKNSGVNNSDKSNARRYVEINAEIELLSYGGTNADGTAGGVNRRSYPFRCVVGTNEWRIDDEFPINGKDARYYDGTNVYSSPQVTRLATNPLIPFARPSMEVMKSNHFVTITPSPGGYPLGDLGVNIEWLAFCSGTYLRREGRVVPLPTMPFPAEPNVFGSLDQVQTFDDSLGLPQKVDLFTSQERYTNGLLDERLPFRDRELQARISALPSTTPDGLLKFRYMVREATNFGGWNFPLEFEYTAYQQYNGGAGRKFVGGVGKLTSIRETTKPGNVFAPEMRQTIFDNRFRSDSKQIIGISYYATNLSEVPPTNRPELQAAFEARLTNAHRVSLPVIGGGK